MFITFEGIEGSGKSTQIRLLADTLRAGGATVLLTREPGGCPVADRIRAVLLDAENRAMVAMTELMLYAAARAQHLAEVVRPALAAGAIVLCDRFSDATRAYQAFGRGLPRETVEQLNQLACDGLAPDLTLLLDCDTATGLGGPAAGSKRRRSPGKSGSSWRPFPFTNGCGRVPAAGCGEPERLCRWCRRKVRRRRSPLPSLPSSPDACSVLPYEVLHYPRSGAGD